LEIIYQRSGGAKKIYFTSPLNVNVIQAARYLNKNRLAEPILLGSQIAIGDFAAAHHLNLRGLKIRNPLHNTRLYGLAKKVFAKNKQLFSLFDIQEKLKTPLWYGLSDLQNRQADFLIAGSPSPFDEFLEAVKYFLSAKDETFISSFHLLHSQADNQFWAVADCSLNVRPSADDLARIALNTAENFTKITQETARVALLSFSTSGSAAHPLAENVRHAARIAKEKRPDLLIEGEIQLDAAMLPEVAAQKLPNGSWQGKANVFIFPSLNAANIGLDIIKYMAGFSAIGPFLQGLRKPVAFLPEGLSEREIVHIALTGTKM